MNDKEIQKMLEKHCKSYKNPGCSDKDAYLYITGKEAKAAIKEIIEILTSKNLTNKNN